MCLQFPREKCFLIGATRCGKPPDDNNISGGCRSHILHFNKRPDIGYVKAYTTQTYHGSLKTITWLGGGLRRVGYFHALDSQIGQDTR